MFIGYLRLIPSVQILRNWHSGKPSKYTQLDFKIIIFEIASNKISSRTLVIIGKIYLAVYEEINELAALQIAWDCRMTNAATPHRRRIKVKDDLIWSQIQLQTHKVKAQNVDGIDIFENLIPLKF